MKETINANIGSRAFILDKDAYDRLSDYLEDVRARLGEDEEETMNDIEIRFVEIFEEMLYSPMMVVSLSMVERAIARMGRPEEFGPECRSRRRNVEAEAKATPARVLRRSRKNRSIAGICGGLANYFDVDATALRLVMLLLILFGGLSIWVYIILWIVIPEEEREFRITNNE